jgi:hypothetical protein
MCLFLASDDTDRLCSFLRERFEGLIEAAE